jgi:hypothetical protein
VSAEPYTAELRTLDGHRVPIDPPPPSLNAMLRFPMAARINLAHFEPDATRYEYVPIRTRTYEGEVWRKGSEGRIHVVYSEVDDYEASVLGAARAIGGQIAADSWRCGYEAAIAYLHSYANALASGLLADPAESVKLHNAAFELERHRAEGFGDVYESKLRRCVEEGRRP